MSSTATTATLSTHILDLDDGLPAAGVAVQLQQLAPVARELRKAITDDDGRIAQWGEPLELGPGTYELRFAISEWYKGQGKSCFYPEVSVAFFITDKPHYHVPLLLNRHGYSTYRGS